MAESIDQSVKASSDILPELYCETCHDLDGKFLQATGYCHKCAEYLCIDCVAAHKRAKLSRNHQLDDQSNMPKTKPQIKLHESRFEPILNDASSIQMLKLPTHLTNIDIVTIKIRGSVILSNQHLVTTDYCGKVTLIDTKSSTIVSELHLPENIRDITKVKSNQVAIACYNEKKIQFVSISSKTLSKVREMPVNGHCRGIAYNNHDQTLVVTFQNPSNVEILNMAGSVKRSFDKDANGSILFTQPLYIALSPDQTLMYISDRVQNSVTMMTLQGEVKAVYTDDKLKWPCGICVSRSSIVYVVGFGSLTVHQIMPGRDKLELLLDQKDGLNEPFTITFFL